MTTSEPNFFDVGGHCLLAVLGDRGVGLVGVSNIRLLHDVLGNVVVAFASLRIHLLEVLGHKLDSELIESKSMPEVTSMGCGGRYRNEDVPPHESNGRNRVPNRVSSLSHDRNPKECYHTPTKCTLRSFQENVFLNSLAICRGFGFPERIAS